MIWELIDLSEVVVEEYRHRQQMRRTRWPFSRQMTDEVKRLAISFLVSYTLKKFF